MLDAYAHQREQRGPQCRYESDDNWEQRLHKALGVPWPCDATAEFWDLWPEVISELVHRFHETNHMHGITFTVDEAGRHHPVAAESLSIARRGARSDDAPRCRGQLVRPPASVDGKRDEFDEEKGPGALEGAHGHYLCYLVETEEILRRAAKYARERISTSSSSPANPESGECDGAVGTQREVEQMTIGPELLTK